MKRNLITVSCIILAAVVVYFIFQEQAPLEADISPSEQLTVDGITRHYRIVIPHTHPKHSPIVFAFHGVGDSTESMANYSQLDQLAANEQFILVYPAALNSSWTTHGLNANKFDINPDVQFFDQLLKNLLTRYEIDSNRVYVIGMSSGASFIQLLAAARSNKITAIAAHSGSKPRTINIPKNPRPILLIAGEKDTSAVRAMQANLKQYRKADGIVKFIAVPNLGHKWSTRHNTEIWKFLFQYPLSDTPKQQFSK